jgi:hypothetical protein
VTTPRHPDRRHLRPVGPVPPRLRPPPPNLDQLFVAPPEPDALPLPPPEPSWVVLRDLAGRVARDCYQPEHGRPAIALTRLFDLVARRAEGGASVISFADLHAVTAPPLIGETDG